MAAVDDNPLIMITARSIYSKWLTQHCEHGFARHLSDEGLQYVVAARMHLPS